MQVYNISNQIHDKMIHNASQSKTFREEFATMLPASIKQIEQAETGGVALGFTMVPEEGKQVVYGMSARLSEKSTKDNPIVQIRSNLNGENKVYSVEINKINPQHASQMEMFALCSYADYMGDGTGSTFGSYPKIPKSIIHMLAHIQFKEFHDFFLKRCHCCINLLALPFNSNHPQGFHFIYDFLHIMAFKPSRLVHDVFDL